MSSPDQRAPWWRQGAHFRRCWDLPWAGSVSPTGGRAFVQFPTVYRPGECPPTYSSRNRRPPRSAPGRWCRSVCRPSAQVDTGSHLHPQRRRRSTAVLPCVVAQHDKYNGLVPTYARRCECRLFLFHPARPLWDQLSSGQDGDADSVGSWSGGERLNVWLAEAGERSRLSDLSQPLPIGGPTVTVSRCSQNTYWWHVPKCRSSK